MQDGGFIYDSVKDTLRWNNLSPKQHVHTVMSIGNLLALDDKTFNSVKDKNSFAEISKEELDAIYKEYNIKKDSHGKDKNYS